MIKLFETLVHMFYPSRCPMCGKVVEKDGKICGECIGGVTEITLLFVKGAEANLGTVCAVKGAMCSKALLLPFTIPAR